MAALPLVMQQVNGKQHKKTLVQHQLLMLSSTVSPDLAGCRRLSCARAPLLRGDRLDLELIVQLAIRALAKRLAHLDYADAARA